MDEKAAKNRRLYTKLRALALGRTPDNFGIELITDAVAVYSVVMDFRPEEQVIATVVGSVSGDASLYTSGGFGVIGGFRHDAVRKAAVSLVDVAQSALERFHTTSEYPEAVPGETRFFALTNRGVLTAAALDVQLERSDHPLDHVWGAAHGLILALRDVVERGNSDSSAGEPPAPPANLN